MTRAIKRIFLGLALLFCHFTSFSQQNKIDSLRFVLKMLNKNPSMEFTPTIKGEDAGLRFDSIKINTLNELAWELMYNNPDTAITLSTQALDLSLAMFKKEEILTPLGRAKAKFIAQSFKNLGVFNWLKGNFTLSLDYHFKALIIWESLNYKKGISTTFGNIGLVYHDQGDYPKALDYYFKALKMDEELRNKKGVARHFGNIGNVYTAQKDYSKALNYYLKALKMAEELGEKGGISHHYANIGIVYDAQGDRKKALDYYFKALKMYEELGNKSGAAVNLGNIGLLYYDQAKEVSLDSAMYRENLFAKALYYHFKALKMSMGVADKEGTARHLGDIGALYTDTKKYKDGEEYLQKALALSTEIKSLDLIEEHQRNISELYEKTHRPAQALEHYKKYIIARDSIFNEENTKKTVRLEMMFDFKKKETIAKAEQEKQNVLVQEEKQKQKIILILVSCFLLLVVVFASFMFNRWRITQRQKNIIERQKEKIVDSITYAQLIQQSILMEENEIQTHLPDSFIYFQPKDIVSGDLYWFSKVNDKIILAAIDCTGHGVPGAFMSMIGNTLLNQIVNEKQITVPSEVLQLLNKGIYESLHQQKNGTLSRDGMDIALCCIDYKNKQVQYAGAHNPLYVLTDNEITVIKADRQTIGGGGFITTKRNSMNLEYTNHVIPLKKGMSIYLFSDGYNDQFGGKDRKKFGAQKFKELLLNSQHLSMQKQKELIVAAHQEWKGNTAQIDDVLVVGIKL